MWDEFSMLGEYEINGLENFIDAMERLKDYIGTMHLVMNVHGDWEEKLYKGETYCVASHIFEKENRLHKLDMGIIYYDAIEIRDETAKFISRNFSLKWQKTDILDTPQK